MPAALRMLDAAANRAREGLRVMEDVCRFALSDGELTETLKGLRHRLQAAMADLAGLGVDPASLLDSRDVAGDPGTVIEGSGESSRADLHAVAMAAGSRTAEALRTLEEVAKTFPAPPGVAHPWHAIESIRYAVYDAQKRLAHALAPPARQWRLCVLITEALCRHPWEVVAREALAAGADCLQLREKALDSGELLARARRLVEIARPAGADVIINDRPDIALLAGAAGVHVGQTDLSVADIRRLGSRDGRRLLVGVSCSTLDHARRAVADGADYLGLGPMFVSTTKVKEVLAGPELIEAALNEPATARLPHLAISGINASNIGRLTEVGCRGVAISSAICGAEDVDAAVKSLID